MRIGLEVHCQLTSVKTKLFCACSTDYRDSPPNTHICPVCAGTPGALPKVNRRAVEEALRVVLALHATPPKRALFYRKNYFYPDLPKNFQISQYDKAGGVPLGLGGWVDIGGKRVRLRRIHLEEDPGKLSYEGAITTSPYTLIDYNRSGVPLLEIVTEPDIESPREARRFLDKLREILEHLGVCDGSLEGAMRCDANISFPGGERVEIKNISSFREVERALRFEATRQRGRLERGIAVGAETRHWDDVRRVTVSLRVKESEEDYRYFPEPDLPPLEIDEAWLERLRATLPELPDAKKVRFEAEYHLTSQQAEVLAAHRQLARLFEEAVKEGGAPRRVAAWLLTEVLGHLKRHSREVEELRVGPSHLAQLSRLVEEGRITEKAAKEALYAVLETGELPQQLLKREKRSDRAWIESLVAQVFRDKPQAVADARKNPRAVNYLLGEVMKLSQGQADPQVARALIMERLQEGG